MSVSRVARTVSIGMLLLLGGSGALVGLQLLGAMATVDARPSGPGSGALIAAGIAGYGLALVAAAVGMIVGRRWGRPLGVVGILVGLAVLVVVVVISDGDEIVLGGLVVWAVTLVALVLARDSL